MCVHSLALAQQCAIKHHEVNGFPVQEIYNKKISLSN